MDTEGEREGGRNRDSSFDVYTLGCVKEITSGKMRYNTGSSALRSVMT